MMAADKQLKHGSALWLQSFPTLVWIFKALLFLLFSFLKLLIKVIFDFMNGSSNFSVFSLQILISCFYYIFS